MRVGTLFLWFCWIFALFYAFSGTAQIKDFNFRQISLGEGLSQSSVFAIVQDDDGFMWFGTQDGLNQYDGYRFKVHKKRAFDSTSLSHSHIRALLKDQSGNLWIGTAYGLNRLDRKTKRLINVSYLLGKKSDAQGFMVNCLYEDSEGLIWVGTANGLAGIRLISKPGQAPRYQTVYARADEKDENSLSSGHILSLLQDRQGHLWIGTRNGLNRLDKDQREKYKTHQKFAFRNPRNSLQPVYQLEGKYISALVQDRFGKLWIGTGGGLYRANSESNEAPEHYSQAEESRNENPENASSPRRSLSSNQVYSLLYDSQGMLWIGTLGGGIQQIVLSPKGQVREITQIKPHNVVRPDVSNDFVLCMYESKEKKDGTLWFGLEAGGVAQFNPSKNNFRLYRRDELSANTLSGNNIFSVLKDHEGQLWIGTSQGLNRYNPDTRQYTQYYHQPDDSASLSGNLIFVLYEDKEGYLWIGTRGGLSRYNFRKKKIERVRMQVDGKVLTNVGTITSFCEDSQGQLWIGASYDLIRLDKRTLRGKSYGYQTENAKRRTGGRITTIYEDQQQNLWIGTYAGLNRYDRQKDDFVHYTSNSKNTHSLSSNAVFSIMQDRRGIYWIATDLGLNKMIWDGNNASFSHYMEKDGLPNNFIYSVLPDNQGRIWMSTNLGISVLDPKTNTFTNYDERDGLQSKEFNAGAYHRARDGELFFGGIHGLNGFYPERMMVNQHVPKVRIVALYKFEEPVNLDSLRNRSEVITFDYNDNFFSFEFVSLDYANPQKNRYAYQLEGFDKDWIYCGNRRYASFTNLDPGEYVFKVKGSNDSGIWNDQSVASIRLRIRPPFWRTWWFYGLSLAVVLVNIKIIHEMRVRRQLKHLLELEKIRTSESEKIRRQTASDFHDEMGNRITRIGVLTELIKVQLHGQHGGEIGTLLSKISENCNTLYNGTRDFIWSINPDNNSFYEVAVRLKDFGDELFDNTAVHFRVGEISEELRHVKLPMDWSRQLILIFKEALNNVLKHADCRNVHLQFCIEEEEEVCITLNDDGRGFEKGMNRGGTGLNNMTNRAKKINSRLLVTSEKNAGTKIILTGRLPHNGGVLV